MVRRVLLLLILLAPAVVAADEPKAVIQGKTEEVRPDESLLLLAGDSKSEKPLRWKVRGNRDLFFVTFDQGGAKNVAFYAPKMPPGRFRITLIAVGTVDGELQADADVVDVIVAEPAPPSPPPTPTPTPTPTPPEPVGPEVPEPAAQVPASRFGMAQASRTGLLAVKGLPGKQRKQQAAMLAAAQHELANRIRGGEFTAPDQIVVEWRKVNRAVVSSADWAPWAGYVTPKWVELWTGGKLTTTADMAEVFDEIASGLEGK